MSRQRPKITTVPRQAVKPAGRSSWADAPLAAHPLTRYLHAHYEWVRVHGYSEETIRTRQIALRRFVIWCAERGLDDPRAITAPILERYQRALFYYRKPDGTPMTLGSQRNCLTSLKAFFKWLARERHLLYNPAAELILPKMPQRLPRALLSIQDIEAILHEAEPDTITGLRDRAMLELLYATGLRRMEVAGLARYDVDLMRRLVFVREGKGRKDRVVPLGERAAAWLDKYLVEARPQLLSVETEALFVNDYGEPLPRDWLAGKVKRHMRGAGIDRPGATHLFRHACATHMLENGADVRYIQEMLGHASLTTTEIYTHVSIDKLQRIHAATHPAGKLGRKADITVQEADDAVHHDET